MAALVTISSFSGLAPPWSLTQLDTDLTNLRDAIQSQNTFSNFAVDTGAANAYVTTPAAGLTATLTAGLMLQFKATNANTGASTLNHAGLGVKNILNIDGSALATGQIPLNAVVQVVYDGTQFLLLNTVPVLVTSFTSAETAIGGASTNTTVAHGLVVVPRLVYVVLRNKTAELGYSIGDEVTLSNVFGATALAVLSIYCDATNVGIVQSAGNINIWRKDTFVGGAITIANWKYVVRAWR